MSSFYEEKKILAQSNMLSHIQIHHYPKHAYQSVRIRQRAIVL